MQLDPSCETERRYANWVQVAFSQDEFLLDFGQVFDGHPPQVHTGIVTTPRLLRAMVATLQESLTAHEHRFPEDQDTTR
jgi:hypothetical protein